MPEAADPTAPDAIAAVRRFSRFYTRQLGLLDEGLLRSAFSLTEARVLYELAHRGGLTASDLCRDLGLDAGYLSRILKTFEQDGFLVRAAAPGRPRHMVLTLTDIGHAALAPLDRASQENVHAMIGHLDPEQKAALADAMRTIEVLMGGGPVSGAPVILRPYRLGDLGWIVRRQSILYAQEYGWDETYEPLAAEILAGFVKSHDPARERGWIADRNGETVGAVFLMRGPEDVAKLRLLHVEPSARGAGLGRRLVGECIGFARAAGYKTLRLWTQSELVPARLIYAAAGFVCTMAEPYRAFGKDLISETWCLEL
jgi:DNA-binding MarR family transcriptional regulator/GNAT superfamily N-acetyltransferase